MPPVTFQVLEGIDKGKVYRDLPTPVTIGREEGNGLRLNDGSESDYAFGWFLKKDLWRRRLEHPGSWNGYQAFIVRYPDERFTVVLLANRSDVDLGDLADRIVRIYAGPFGAL